MKLQRFLFKKKDSFIGNFKLIENNITNFIPNS
jgi:hypothetical protein